MLLKFSASCWKGIGDGHTWKEDHLNHVTAVVNLEESFGIWPFISVHLCSGPNTSFSGRELSMHTGTLAIPVLDLPATFTPLFLY